MFACKLLPTFNIIESLTILAKLHWIVDLSQQSSKMQCVKEPYYYSIVYLMQHESPNTAP